VDAFIEGTPVVQKETHAQWANQTWLPQQLHVGKQKFTSIIFISETVTISEDYNNNASNNEEKLTEPEKENEKEEVDYQTNKIYLLRCKILGEELEHKKKMHEEEHLTLWHCAVPWYKLRTI
jgi:hypothetical protein